VLFFAFLITFLVARQIFFNTLVFGDYTLVNLDSGPIIAGYVFNGWHLAAYGQSNPAPLTYMFLFAFSQLASFVASFTGPTQVFNLLMSLSFPLSFCTFYFFSKKFCESMWTRIFGGAFYIVNPITLMYFNSGGFMWALVFLPLALSFFIDLLEKHDTKSLALVATFSILTTWAFPNIMLVLFFLLIAVAFGYFLISGSKISLLKSVLPWLILFAIAAIIANSTFIFAQYTYTQGPLYGYNSASVLSDFRYTYHLATNYNILSFSGNWASTQYTFGYLDPENVANEIGIIIPLIAFSSVFWILRPTQKRDRVFAMLVSVGLTASFILFLRTIIRYNFTWIITSSPLLWTLRNPVKFQLILLVCMIPLFIFSLEKIALVGAKFFKKKKFKFAGIAVVLIVLGVSQLYIYNPFVINGYAGLDLAYPNSYSPDTTITNIVGNFTNLDNGTYRYRGIILPFDHHTELQVQFTNPLLYPSILGLTSDLTNTINDALEVNSNLTNLLSLLSTKYVYINNAWSNTGFGIIQPINPSTNQIDTERLITELTNETFVDNATETNNTHYSTFNVTTALPTVYLSNYPVFYSSLKTIDSLDSSVFNSYPVFLNMQYAVAEINSSNTSNSTATSYTFDAPFQGTYNLNATIISNQTGNVVGISYSLDGGEIQPLTANITGTHQNLIATFDLKAGPHKFVLIQPTEAFVNLSTTFSNPTSGSNSTNLADNSITIYNGILTTNQNYTNFDCSLEFKPIQFGPNTWNGPEFIFAQNKNDTTSYWRLIFHKGGYIELVQVIGNTPQTAEIVRSDNLNENSWNSLRVIKDGNTVSVDLNGQSLLTYRLPYSVNESIGGIGLGSDTSKSEFENVTVSPANGTFVESLGMLPTGTPNATIPVQVSLAGGEYTLRFNPTQGSQIVVFLGESYDPNWQATLDGTVIDAHSKANMYGNCWFVNVTSGTHEIKLSYKPNNEYRDTIYLSLSTVVFLIVVACIPRKTRNKLNLRITSAEEKIIPKKVRNKLNLRMTLAGEKIKLRFGKKRVWITFATIIVVGSLIAGGLYVNNLPSKSSPSPAPKTNEPPTSPSLVIRGPPDGNIYYRPFNNSAQTWNSWVQLPTGATPDSPAAVLAKNELHIVVRGNDDIIEYGYVNEAGIFSNFTSVLDGSSKSAPALTIDGTILYLVVQAKNHHIVYSSCDLNNGHYWNAWKNFTDNGVTSDSPTATVYAGKLYVVVRDTDANSISENSTSYCYLDLSTKTFSQWSPIPNVATQSAPTLTTCNSLGEIVLVLRDLDNIPKYFTLSNSSWTGPFQFPSGATCDGPGACVVGNELHVIVRDLSGFLLYETSVNLVTNSSPGWSKVYDKTALSKPTFTAE